MAIQTILDIPRTTAPTAKPSEPVRLPVTALLITAGFGLLLLITQLVLNKPTNAQDILIGTAAFLLIPLPLLALGPPTGTLRPLKAV